MMKKPSFNVTLLSVFALLFLVGCRSVDNSIEYETMEPKDLGISFIGRGELHGAGEEKIKEGCLVINNQEDWDELMAKMNKVNKVSDGFERQGVNFEEETIIACFDKVESTGGYEFEVKQVIEKSNVIEVHYTVTAPKGSAITILTQPYHIVTVRASTKPVKFFKTME